jgi:hypothetical protein
MRLGSSQVKRFQPTSEFCQYGWRQIWLSWQNPQGRGALMGFKRIPAGRFDQKPSAACTGFPEWLFSYLFGFMVRVKSIRVSLAKQPTK